MTKPSVYPLRDYKLIYNANSMAKIDEIEVYRAYIRAKGDPKTTVTDVANDFMITRTAVYDIVKRIENGNVSKIRRCTENSRVDCLWEYKYKARFLAIPKDRKVGSVNALRALINDMKGDKFPVSKISTLTGKDRSTVLFHINNK